MKTFGNILWLIFGGFFSAIASFIMGAFLCVTIIFIPVGLQFFKVGKFFLGPMGKKVVRVKPNGFKTFLNVLWAIFFGWESAFAYCLVGLFLCITIIGIPFGRQYFKIAKFVFTPLGNDFVKEDNVPAAEANA